MAKKKLNEIPVIWSKEKVAGREHPELTPAHKDSLRWDDIPECAKDLQTLFDWIENRADCFFEKAKEKHPTETADFLLGTSSVGFAYEQGERLGVSFADADSEVKDWLRKRRNKDLSPRARGLEIAAAAKMLTLLAGEIKKNSSQKRAQSQIDEDNLSPPQEIKRWATLFDRTPKTVREWFKKGTVTAKKVGRGMYRVAVSEVPQGERITKHRRSKEETCEPLRQVRNS
jgi:hypothetical protein